MRRLPLVIALILTLGSLLGCSQKQAGQEADAKQVGEVMNDPKTKEWYQENANKTPNAETNDSLVTGSGQGSAGGPATN
jgi:hypothetical protein